ncbi:ventrally expressed dharma/bozozok antagonist [Parambassis ranga]|uniref:Ventrally expressed dharma/bozozok antagonist n=1 Tax=Parambassis ranga TaxID=210632 RepID=A0A6P7JBD6_9TELE|nr:homeobox protein vent1-like [Parambassis ranga]
MRGHFSIEWMAQSSRPAGPDSTGSSTTTTTTSLPASGPAACGTHSESLPGFYCRQKSENVPQEEQQDSRSHEEFSSVPHRTSPRSRATEGGFSSGTEEEETSGYESEGGHSISPPSAADCTSTSPASSPMGRRPRTAFTAEQISSLEKAFKKNTYLGQQDKAELCRKLSLSDKQVRNWFQNRRMKLKRTVQDALAHACQVNAASQFMHYPELQTYRPGPYPRYHPAAAAVVAAASAVTEAPPAAAASYVHPHSLQYSSPLPLDSLYPYSGGLPGMVLPSASPHLRGSYPSFPQYY